MTSTHEPPWTAVMKMITGSWVSQAVGAAARLGFADALAGGPRTAEDLARSAGAHAPSVLRLLSALSAMGVFAQPSPGTFANTPLSECLRSGAKTSLRELAIAETDHVHWATWERFTDSVRRGEPMTREAIGVEPWDYYGKHPEEAAMFSAAMGNLSAIATPAVLDAYDFSQVKTIVDVGGAHGGLLGAILRSHATVRGMLVDLPHVVAGARPALEKLGVADRVEVLAGDFFVKVPSGGDLYLLKHIIHDWNDERAVAILETCRAAMGPEARLLLVELVVPPNNEPSPAQLMDLNMMVMLGGKERTQREYAGLLESAKLSLQRVIPTHSPFSLLEAVRT